MAKKIRTGWEVMNLNHAARYITVNEFNQYACAGEKLITKFAYFNSNHEKNFYGADTSTFPDQPLDGEDTFYAENFYSTTSNAYCNPNNVSARSLNANGKGCTAVWYNGQNGIGQFDASKFTEGFFANWWSRATGFYIDPDSGGANAYGMIIGRVWADHGSVLAWIGIVDGEPFKRRIYITDNNHNILAESADITSIERYTWINLKFSVDNVGVIYASYDGVEVSYDMKNLGWILDSGAFSQWTVASLSGQTRNGEPLDDIAVNDGSGGVDNSMPGSIRSYRVTESLAYNDSQSSLVNNNSGVTVDEALSDGDDGTFIEIQKNGELVLDLDTDVSSWAFDQDGNPMSRDDFTAIEYCPVRIDDLVGFAPSQFGRIEFHNIVTPSYKTSEDFALQLSPTTKFIRDFTLDNSSPSNWPFGPSDNYRFRLKYLDS
tara:strand:+ start:11190 stop:12485 length:1296 start_codon:yes stop_codon:yes gene_type:complete